MSKKILIDAAIQEETRLVILQGQKIEAFETEAQHDIKGNIYLARVTRVEPSLQAAFVDYGGNRHGFLAFSEIHPDYFQLPQSEQEALAPKEEAPKEELVAEESNLNTPLEDLIPEEPESSYFGGQDEKEEEDPSCTQTVSSTGKDNDLYKKYNIQDVIKHGQILLVQIAKEERGNKGAALTTFLSLAGRYCVLMPNTSSAGGVSRKLGFEARNKIRSLVEELEVPDGMSLIMRTAGAQQSKEDIERDFEYLIRLWESVRNLTVSSIAPTLIYEEGNLVQRALRDFVKRDTAAIHIEGADAFAKAQQYVEKLMPQHVSILHEHREASPIFAHYGVENLLDDMLQPTVQLKSGGYIVINPTEALVAIDVNSGKATSEHNIENTALKTNLEAAEEIARQARLRDLAGLIVVDFIDMEKAGNVREVEKRMRDAVRHDRAKVQTGRISQSFGLLEMSRQRLSPELSERRTEPCTACNGSGQVLSDQTVALRALREAVALASRTGKSREVVLRLNWPVVLYLLNERKDELLNLEQEQGIKIRIEAGGIDNPDKPWTLETRKVARNGSAPETEKEQEVVSMETAYQQMSAPTNQGAHQESAGQPQHQRERQNRRGNRSRRNQHGSHNNSGGQQRRSQNKRHHKQNHKSHKAAGGNTGAQAGKPSLWNKLFGKK